jgi:hypothetical protein
MEFPVASQFVILSIHPVKGRIVIDNIRFRYSLSGALLMDLFLRKEISLTGNRVETALKPNYNAIHTILSTLLAEPKNPKRVSFWLRRITRKSRLVLKEIINSLSDSGIVRHERRYFLNIIPYNRYFITDTSIRTKLIEELRNVLLQNKTATEEQAMLIGIIKASESYRILAREFSERRLIRKKCNEYLKNNPLANEVSTAVREIRAAIIASISVAVATSHTSHH